MSTISRIRSKWIPYKGWKWMEYAMACALTLVLVIFIANAGHMISSLVSVSGFCLIIFLLCFYKVEIGYYGLIILGILVAMLSRMITTDLPWASIVLFMPYLLFCFVLIQGLIKRRKSWVSWHPLTVMFLVTIIYSVIQFFNPNMNSLLGWVSSFRGKLSYLFFFLITLYIINNLKSARLLIKFLLISAFITGLYGCIQQWFGFASFDKRWLSDPRIYQLFSLPGNQVRKFSFFTDPANFGTLMAATGLGTLIMAFGPFPKFERISMFVMSIFIFLGMSYSGTRTAYVMVPAGIALYILMNLNKRKAQILAVASTFIFLAILYVPIYGNVTLNRVRSAFQPPSDDASYNIRTIHRHFIQPYIYTHPFGGGVNTAGGNGLKYNPDHYLAHFPPDSAYLSVAVELGWVGLIISFSFLFMILFYGVHYFFKCKNPELKTYYSVLVVILFSLLVGAYAQYTYSNIPQVFYFYVFIALIIKLQEFDTPELTKTNL